MRNHDSWKWPLVVGVAVSLFLLGFVFTPRSWIFLLPQASSDLELPEGSTDGVWLVLKPPPEIVVETDRPEHEPPEPPAARDQTEEPDPDWWRRGVQIRIADHGLRQRVVRTQQSARDSVQAVLDLLGVSSDLLTRSRPDSLLAARLFALELSEGFAFDQWKPYLAALARADDYADIMSRAADMFDNFLDREIMVPAQAERDEHSP